MITRTLAAVGALVLSFQLPNGVVAFVPPKKEAAPILQREASSHLEKNDPATAASTHAVFPHSPPPYLALITMRESCDTDAHLDTALWSLKEATHTGCIDLVSVRVNVNNNDNNSSDPQRPERLTRLIQTLLEWSATTNGFRVVVSSDWMEVGLQAGAHGIHFKEDHRDKIERARQLRCDGSLLVGTSTHSVPSAVEAVETYNVDYLFTGTCFPTESHPEKPIVEGPQLPAEVKRAVPDTIPVLSIGGLDETNCGSQVTLGQFVNQSRSDGVALIRSVLQSKSPAPTTRRIKNVMRAAMQTSPSN